MKTIEIQNCTDSKDNMLLQVFVNHRMINRFTICIMVSWLLPPMISFFYDNRPFNLFMNLIFLLSIMAYFIIRRWWLFIIREVNIENIEK